MRFILRVILMFGLVVTASSAFALQASDTMQAWKTASGKERSDLLASVLGKDAAGNAGISRCMDETSKTEGHADLPVSEVAKACAKPANAGEPI